MSDIFNYVFNDFFGVDSKKVYRPYPESERYKFYKKEGKGYILSVDARGVSEEDLKISLTHKEYRDGDLKPFISVKGSSKNEFSNETYSIDFSGYLLMNEEIEKLEYNHKDGVCVIFIKTKQPEKAPEVSVKSTKKLSWD